MEEEKSITIKSFMIIIRSKSKDIKKVKEKRICIYNFQTTSDVKLNLKEIIKLGT
jgi:hypothetical protein